MSEEFIREVDEDLKEEKRLKLWNPIYYETASYGHMGRESKFVKKSFTSSSGDSKEIEVELFTWEKLDYVDKIKERIKTIS